MDYEPRRLSPALGAAIVALDMWDNRCAMSYAVSDYRRLGDRRMHRAAPIAARPGR